MMRVDRPNTASLAVVQPGLGSDTLSNLVGAMFPEVGSIETYTGKWRRRTRFPVLTSGVFSLRKRPVKRHRKVPEGIWIRKEADMALLIFSPPFRRVLFPSKWIMIGLVTAMVAEWNPWMDYKLIDTATANVLPDATVDVNVIPGLPSEYCVTTIDDCNEMHMSTDAQGLVAFQIFVNTSYLHYSDPVTSFVTKLDWPDEWTLVDGAFCEGGEGTFEYWGPGPYPLEITWPCSHRPHGMFLALELVLDVHGYGTLDFIGNTQVHIGCPPAGQSVNAFTGFGEAGTNCEYTDEPCHAAFGPWYCIPGVDQDSLLLVTTVGGTVHEEIVFGSGWGMDHSCHGAFDAVTDADWCSARVEDGVDPSENILVIDADASGLGPGQHESTVQVLYDGSGGAAARCLEVILDVAEPTSLIVTTWGRIKALYR